MQHEQHAARQNSVGQRDPKSMRLESSLSWQHVIQLTSISFSLQNLPRSMSSRSSIDIAMTEAPQSVPRIFVADALSDADCQVVTELAHQLKENPFDFGAHISFINSLRKGFTKHALKASDAHSYELLTDLRDARQTMNKIFPLGETLWADWLEDEKVLARTIEDRIRVMELFKCAVSDEPSSASLWRLYGDYMYYLWATAYDVTDEEIDAESWNAEDKEIGKEVFKWEPMMAVWEQGVNNTQRRLNDSNTVWDRYMEMLIQDQSKWPSPQKFQNIKAKFAERLATAHATSDQTSSMFSTFISRFDNAAWDDTMMGMTKDKHIKQAKNIYLTREPHELNISRAARTGDEAAEWAAYSEYLDWELETQGVSSFPMINALYERATIRFPSHATLWNDYVEFLIEHPTKELSVLAVTERATRHCPWSGDLWSQRLLTMEAESKDFTEIETAKHDATATGLLDVGGLDELLKVYIAWCGCLRRRAFMPGATEDELDIAEVAIRSALEHVKKVAEKKDSNYTGDPQYRLERIHIKFLTQRGEFEAARANWKALVAVQVNSYDFWYRFYIWEMVMWAKFAMRANSEPETQLRTPDGATAVLREALTHASTLDWPEQLITMFLNHCEQHESVQELRKAVIEARRVTKVVTQRRQKEAAEAAAAYQNQNTSQAGFEEAEAQTYGKRKRELEASAEEGAAKKHRIANAESTVVAQSVPVQPVRNREHAVILVKNLPSDTTEIKVRQFFRDVGFFVVSTLSFVKSNDVQCGTIKTLKLASEGDQQVATIEFADEQEALYAQTKSVRQFDGNDIAIEFNTGTTLWVTNYPPEADKDFIRDLFSEVTSPVIRANHPALTLTQFGEVTEVRLPSLQGNTRRRFCYVQFRTPEQAYNATQLDGKDLGGQYKLQAKISDPGKKADRIEALMEGREIVVKNVYWHTRDDELEEHFSSCGTVESVRIPKEYDGKSKGIAFVVFKDKVSKTNTSSHTRSALHKL
jgi:RNA recognition motif-containing protein